MRSYEAIAEWADRLTQHARGHLNCYYTSGKYVVPSLSILRNVLVRVDLEELEAAFRRCNEAYSQDDNTLAIDGKLLCNSIDEDGRQTQIISAIGIPVVFVTPKKSRYFTR